MNAAQGTILIMIGGLILYLSWHPASPFANANNPKGTVFKTKEEQEAFDQGQRDAPSIIEKKTAPGYWPPIIPPAGGGGGTRYSYVEPVDNPSSYIVIS